MAYSTQQDILNSGISEDELSQLTSETPGAIGAGTVTAAIKKADDEIDGYVAVRYSVPLSPVPSIINTLSIAIAKYRLFEGRVHRMGGIPDGIQKAYDQAVNKLKDIARGLHSLGIDPPAPAKSTGQPEVKTNVGDDETSRDFSKNKLSGM